MPALLQSLPARLAFRNPRDRAERLQQGRCTVGGRASSQGKFEQSGKSMGPDGVRPQIWREHGDKNKALHSGANTLPAFKVTEKLNNSDRISFLTVV